MQSTLVYLWNDKNKMKKTVKEIMYIVLFNVKCV